MSNACDGAQLSNYKSTEQHVQLLLETIEHLTEHLELDEQIYPLQDVKATLTQEWLQLDHKKTLNDSKKAHRSDMVQAYCTMRENSELKLQMMKWRKRVAVLKLKQSSMEETVQQLQLQNKTCMTAMEELVRDNSNLSHNLSEVKLMLEKETRSSKEGLSNHVLENEALAQRLQYTMTQNSCLTSELNDKTAIIADLEVRVTDLGQQLSGAQMLASSANRLAEGLEAQVAKTNESLKASELESKRLRECIQAAHAENENAVFRLHSEEAKVLVLEQRLKLSEQALESWKVLDADRMRLVKERDEQVRNIAEERAKLTSDRASVNESRLQAQAAILQSQLDSEISIRHQAELSLKQQLASAQQRLDAESNRAMLLDKQLGQKHHKVLELEEALRLRVEDTPGKVVSRAIKNVDNILSQLLPVEEGEEEGEEEDLLGGDCMRRSGSEGITAGSSSLLKRNNHHGSMHLLPAAAQAATLKQQPVAENKKALALSSDQLMTEASGKATSRKVSTNKHHVTAAAGATTGKSKGRGNAVSASAKARSEAVADTDAVLTSQKACGLDDAENNQALNVSSQSVPKDSQQSQQARKTSAAAAALSPPAAAAAAAAAALSPPAAAAAALLPPAAASTALVTTAALSEKGLSASDEAVVAAVSRRKRAVLADVSNTTKDKQYDRRSAAWVSKEELSKPQPGSTAERVKRRGKDSEETEKDSVTFTDDEVADGDDDDDPDWMKALSKKTEREGRPSSGTAGRLVQEEGNKAGQHQRRRPVVDSFVSNTMPLQVSGIDTTAAGVDATTTSKECISALNDDFAHEENDVGTEPWEETFGAILHSRSIRSTVTASNATEGGAEGSVIGMLPAITKRKRVANTGNEIASSLMRPLRSRKGERLADAAVGNYVRSKGQDENLGVVQDTTTLIADDGGLPGVSKVLQEIAPSTQDQSACDNLVQQPHDTQSQSSRLPSGGLGFLEMSMLPLFKSRVAANPLATLNSRVLEAAAARRSRLSVNSKQALRRMSLGGSSLPHGPGSKMKSLKSSTTSYGIGGEQPSQHSDVLPSSLLMDSLKLAKLQ
ncbi:hypothetical protein CEUSTIGMA_g8449.t1 [Chlamydomonas eustigma]|uniref:Uncharacterized protein n=1 Tax=Chlamydomonas eustigma TaxID=1157962 RepID=A0A250XD55_9CHLO|nr:hypothetical protein CEUSTIGMA_g8449.t1 [Chlamydomonas eustigma]|eukprot:GAX81014.1 hypothetical protein CEUSTIGMA_g8449.t1 [Chlamydomonas eustigma]